MMAHSVPGFVTQVIQTDQTGSVEQVGARHHRRGVRGARQSQVHSSLIATNDRAGYPNQATTMTTKALRRFYLST